MKRFLAALAVFAVALSADGQGFDFRTTGSTTTQVVNLRCSTLVPAVSVSSWAKLWVPCSGVVGYNAGNVYISQNTGAWTLLSSFVGSGVVNSIFGRTGTVVAVSGDYTATLVTNTPAGGIAATTVQAAITELDTEKANIASPTFTGVPAVPTAAPGTNTTQAASTAFTTAAVAAATGAVTSVFTRTGAVTAQQSDYDSFFTTTAEASAAAPVQSVFGRTGAVAALQADYDAFFLTTAEGDAAYLSVTDGTASGSLTLVNFLTNTLLLTVHNTSTTNGSTIRAITDQATSPVAQYISRSPTQSWVMGMSGAPDWILYDDTAGRYLIVANASDGKVTTNLSSTSTGVTAAAADNDTSLATTAFVQQEAPVKSVAGMTGNVTIASTDLTDNVNPFKGGTGIDSSASTGVPRLLSGVWTIDAGISHLASSTSAQLDTVLSDDTGSGVAVFNDTPTILTPTIASFVNATHTHVSAATGGALDAGALGSGTLPLARGGTNAVDASGARTSLGLAIGSDVQAFDADLSAFAALTSAADKLPYSTGAQTWALTDFTAAGRAILDDADATAQRTTLGLAIGTNVEAWDADLDALASSGSTGTGAFVRAGSPTFTGAPVLAAPTATTIETSGHVGIGKIPSVSNGEALDILDTGNFMSIIRLTNANTGSAAGAQFRAVSDASILQFSAFSSGWSASAMGVTLAGWSWINNGATGNGLLLGTNSATPLRLGTNSTTGQIFDATNPHPSFPVSDKRVSAQFDKTSDTTLANVTGLSVTLTAAKTYRFSADLSTSSNASGGVKFAIAGTATATAIIYNARCTEAGFTTIGTARGTALATTVGNVTAVTAAHCTITGTITVNAAGTLTVQFAQNASDGTASSVLVGSTLSVVEVQ